MNENTKPYFGQAKIKDELEFGEDWTEEEIKFFKSLYHRPKNTSNEVHEYIKKALKASKTIIFYEIKFNTMYGESVIQARHEDYREFVQTILNNESIDELHITKVKKEI